MAPSVTYVLCKPEDLVLDFQHTYKNQVLKVHIYNPDTAEWG